MILRNIFFILLFISSTGIASGFRQWDERPYPSKANWYIGVRAGVGKLNAKMENDIQSFSTTYCQYYAESGDNTGYQEGEDTINGYGPCHSAADGAILTNLAKWDDWDPHTPEMDKITGFYSFAVGGYLPYHNKIRIELEWTQHNDFDYSDDTIYQGYPIYVGAPHYLPDGVTLDPNAIQPGDLAPLDDKMETQFKSTVSSSHIMFRVFYDFTEKGRTIGEWTPFVGAGIGLANNKTKFTLIDPQAELVYDDSGGVTGSISPLYDFDGDMAEKVISHQNFAWGLSAGLNYVLSEHLSFDLGLNYSNLGLIEWGFDESNTFLKSEKLIATDIYLGFRFDF
ncbi:MAG: outer membrane beta-barrel protein [Alphaproteobacteria bacterium]|nr:outer membrane beta-barrel protein [Alphaproteobacteria bacterium]